MRNTTMGRVTVFALFLLTGALAAAEQEASLSGVSYAAGDWPANGRGNHRAVIEVSAAADVVRARIPWRRHDAEFRTKDVLVYDLTTGAKVNNVFACKLTRESGDVVFQPPTAPGQYAVYFLPYQENTSSGSWNGSYLTPRLVAEPAWLAKHGLSASTYSENGIRFLTVPKESDAGALGSSFEIAGGSAIGFADNDYGLSYEVHFVGHRGPCVNPTVLPQDGGRGYKAVVYDYGGRLVMDITRYDAGKSDGTKPDPVHLVKANWDAPWSVNMDRPLHVTVSVKVFSDRTVITSQAQGTAPDGQPFTSPLLKAEDTSPERFTHGAAPTFDYIPMEVIASQAELSTLAGRHSDPLLLFPEDRTRPVVMPDFLPQKWALEGPQEVFRGTCQPSEYYCWQIGVFAAWEDVKRLSLKYMDVRNTAGQVVIRGQDITCFNLEGTNNRGERFTKEFTLSKGMVRPLWSGLMVPDDAQGELRGSVQVRVNNRAAQTIELVLNVDGPVNPYINYPFMTVDRMKQAFEDIKAKGQRGMTIYYTLRELSNITPELFAFRSLGDEIIQSTGAFVYSTEGFFQKAQETFDLSQPMAIEPGKGIVIGVERILP